MADIEVKVPDIGDFKDVPIIDVLVRPGDRVKTEDSLITLESDKASMDVPSPLDGVVKEIKVRVGDKVSEGSLILIAEAEVAPAGVAPREKVREGGHATGEGAPVADYGAASGVYAAIEVRVPDIGDFEDVPVIDVAVKSGDQVKPEDPLITLESDKASMDVPSPAAGTVKEVNVKVGMAAHGISYSPPQIDLDKLRSHKERVVGRLTGGLAGMAKARKVTVLEGIGSFLDPHNLEVVPKNGAGRKVVKFDRAIIAAGSQAIKLPFIPDDPRIVDSTGALELRQLPKSMLVIGGGIIGLEMATVYSTLGTRIDVVEMLDGLMTGADRDLVKVWEKKNAGRFDKVMLKTKTVAAEATSDGIQVRFEGEKAPTEPQMYEMVLVAVGRSPNGKNIAAEKAGVAVSERGFIPVDRQMRTNMPHIFAIGDIVGQPMLAHKAVHEGHVAAETAAGKNSLFEARQIPSVAYTDPEVAWAGLTEDQCKAQGIKYGKAVFPWAASGRAIANGRDEGFTKLLFDDSNHRLLGGGIVGTHAGDLIGEVCLAVEMGCDPVDIGKTIHPHPTLSESIGMAAEVFEGVCTDLPPAKKK